jgi:hypothetical protein
MNLLHGVFGYSIFFGSKNAADTQIIKSNRDKILFHKLHIIRMHERCIFKS